MGFELNIRLNDKLYIKDPLGSELGKQIIKESLRLLDELGFEEFTFKKLAKEIKTTEASVYRYFENKHKLLVYYLAWYWSLTAFKINSKLKDIDDIETKLKWIIEILIKSDSNFNHIQLLNEGRLKQVIISEGSKAFLTKNIEFENKNKLFKPYKDICLLISSLIIEFNPDFEFPHSLATTIMEVSHTHQFNSHHLPSLTDIKYGNQQKLSEFLFHLLMSSIR